MSSKNYLPLPLEDLVQQLDQIRNQRRIVFTNGCFDLLHVGHVRYLRQARALGDVLVVGLNSDSSVRKLKGTERPVQPEQDRAEILLSLDCVSFVTIFSDETPEKLIHAVRPHVLVKGGDWAVEKIVGAQYVQSYGGQVQSLAFVPNRSTSAILTKILKS